MERLLRKKLVDASRSNILGKNARATMLSSDQQVDIYLERNVQGKLTAYNKRLG